LQEILVATSNLGKLQAITSVLEDCDIKLLSLADVFINFENFIEDGKTFEENAIKKAKFAYEKCKIPIIADDSGIIVDALIGELGVKTRRWGAGETVTDAEWVEYFLNRMKNFSNKKAKFVSSIAFYDGINEKIFTGQVDGTITEKLMAPITKGLPLSSCFIPNGANDVFTNLSLDYKIKFGHREKALNMLKTFFKKSGF